MNGPEGITPDSRPLLGPVPGVPGFWAAAGLCRTPASAPGRDRRHHGRMARRRRAAVRREGDERPTLRAGVRGSRLRRRARPRIVQVLLLLRYPTTRTSGPASAASSPLDDRDSAARRACSARRTAGSAPTISCRAHPGAARAPISAAGAGRARRSSTASAREHRAVRERAGLLDFTSFGKLDVSGPGALALLQRLADNDVDRPVGSVIYTQFLNPRGGIESDLTVTRWAPDRFRVTTGSNFVASDLGWIRTHLPSDDSRAGARRDGRVRMYRPVGAPTRVACSRPSPRATCRTRPILICRRDRSRSPAPRSAPSE